MILGLAYPTTDENLSLQYNSKKYRSVVIIVAERLSARLLILESVFSVGGVWPQLPSHLGMQIKVWLVHKHLSHFRMQLVCKKLCIPTFVYCY